MKYPGQNHARPEHGGGDPHARAALAEARGTPIVCAVLTAAQSVRLRAIADAWNAERARYGGRSTITLDYVLDRLLEWAPAGELK